MEGTKTLKQNSTAVELQSARDKDQCFMSKDFWLKYKL